MSTTMNDRPQPTDPFTSFWSDFLSRMGAPAEAARGASPSATASNDMLKQMQRMFLDALAKYCDDYMRSEQFLQMMKQTLDKSLAFKQQMDQFFAQAQKGMQAPARADIDDMAGTLRNLEYRLLARLDELEAKVAAVEGGRRKTGGAGASRAQRPPRRAARPRRKGQR